jgi:hypothetical protein
MRIVDRDRALARNATNCAELFVVATAEDITALTDTARRLGALVYQSAPTPMGGTDPRQRVYLRLYLHHP